MSLARSYLLASGCRNICVRHVRSCMQVHTTVIGFSKGTLSKLLTSMPKVEGPRETLRHVKYRDKRAQGGQKMPAPSRIDVQVIGSGARGTPKSVVITTDYSRYLFNCGEGTQRIAQEHKMKLSKLENVFITYKSWDNMGGLLGMALTLEATNVPQITLHGPDGIEQVVQMAKSFNSQHSTIKLEKKDARKDRFKDSAVAIDYVILERGQDIRSENTVKEQVSDDEAGPAKIPRLDPPSDNQEYTVAYICQPHPPLRKLIIEKCVELGVPTGPLCGRLKEGESITLEDGTVITPDQVLSETEISRPIIVLECPSEEYLQPLMDCGRFHQYQQGGDQPAPNLVIHMTPASVLASPTYQAWMNSFGPDTQHLVLNESTSTIMFEGVYRIQAMLNLIDTQIFPLLPHQKDKENLPPDSRQVTLARTNLTYHYRPRRGFDRDQCIDVDTDRFVETARGRSEVTQELDTLVRVKREAATPDSDTSFPEVIFLGTGSSIPSKVRNVSCILLQMQQNRYMILDCGEGTMGQLYHHCGDAVDDVLENLEAIFVSHMHADHHLGMFGVLEARKRVLDRRGKPHNPILLLAPIQMTRWLKFYSQHIRQSHSYIRLVALQDLLPHKLEVTEGVYRGILEELGLTELLPVSVDHCKNAFGVCLTHKDGWKLVYSGDTMPCNRLVEAGEGCDLLIHEATMEDDLVEEARLKTHSTTSQAIDVGIRMRAKFILLTHFSQRYSKIPVFNEKFSDKVGIAFDNMRVRLKDVKSLPLFTPAIKALFAEEYALLEERTFKRNLNKKKMTKTGQREILELFNKVGEKS